MFKFRSKATSVIAAVVLAIAGLAPAAQAAPGESISIQLSGGSLSGSTISGFDPSAQLYLTLVSTAGKLDWNDTSASGVSLLGYGYNESQGLRFSGTQDQLNLALGDISVNAGCSSHYTVYGQVTLESNFVKDPVTNHVYQYVDSSVLYTDAKQSAEHMMIGNDAAEGYLANITSPLENTIVNTAFGINEPFFGATDLDNEGHWTWGGGPEAGQEFYVGQGDTFGQNVNGGWSNWNVGEPNNWGGQEEYLVIYDNGVWNDSNDQWRPYVVEFGGNAGDDTSSIDISTSSASEDNGSGYFLGNGTPGDPYQVANQTDFGNIMNCTNYDTFFAQTSDITLDYFQGVGSDSTPFLGHFDGNNLDINVINASYNDAYHGVFNVIGDGGSDLNTTVENMNVYGDISTSNGASMVGLAVGKAVGGTIAHVSVDGSITGESSYTGGVLGYATLGTDLAYLQSNADINLTGSSSSVGGIVGAIDSNVHGTHLSTTSNASVMTNGGATGESFGGLVGSMGEGTLLEYSVNNAEVNVETNGNFVAGIAGLVQTGTISKSANYGNVYAMSANYVGGAAGMIVSDATVSRFENHGEIDSAGITGGVIGFGQTSTVEDTLSTGLVSDSGSGTSGAVVGAANQTYVLRSLGTGATYSNQTHGLFGYDNGNNIADSSLWVPDWVGDYTASGAVGNETAISPGEATDIQSYLDQGWNISSAAQDNSIWQICSNYNDGIPFIAALSETGRNWNCQASDFNSANAPVIDGSGLVGDLLTSSIDPWDPSASLRYQWYRDGDVIDGATDSTYTPTDQDFDCEVYVVVTGAATDFFVTSLESNHILVEQGSTPPSDLTLTPDPTFTGTATVGDVLTAVPGTWDDGVTLAYQWLRNGTAIDGATGDTYTVTDADVDQTITLQIVGSKDGFNSATVVSTQSIVGVAPSTPTPPTPSTSLTSKVGGFAGDSWRIPVGFAKSLRAALKAHPNATSVTITGIVKAGGKSSWMKYLGLNRANVVKAMVLHIKPSLVVHITWATAKSTDKVQRGVKLKFNR